MATCNVNTLLETGKDFQRCSDQDLSVCECQLLCDINGGAGAGGGATSGAGSPIGVVVPSGNTAIYFQTDSVPPGVQWNYWGGEWH